MPGEKQMVPGFNHNVKHKGTPYHVQTEDSGIDNPRIITHLFVGGNVIASKKTSYADIVGAENLAQVVRELMEEQHKEMLRNLISGVYDDTEQEVAAKARAFQPGQIAGQPELSTVAWSAAAPEQQRADPLPCIDLTKPFRVAGPAEPAKPPEAAKPAAAPRPPPIPRAAAAPSQRPAPASAPAPERQPARAVSPAAPAAFAPQTDRAPGAQRRGPAPAVQGAASPAAPRREGVGAGFGEDLISEKSLDEVILSYLAEDQAEKT